MDDMTETLTGRIETEFKLIDNKRLTPFEHRFIGSSVDVGGRFFDFNNFESDVAAFEGLPPEYLVPVSVLKGESPEEAAKEREGKYIRGMLGFLGESGIDLFEKGLEPVIELPSPDPITGLYEPKWRMFAVGKNEKPVYDKAILEGLKPAGKFAKYLNFILQEDGIHIYFKNPTES